MGRRAEHVYIDQASIAQLGQRVTQLPANDQLLLVMRDRSRCDGAVCARPAVPMLLDGKSGQGVSASVKRWRPDSMSPTGMDGRTSGANNGCGQRKDRFNNAGPQPITSPCIWSDWAALRNRFAATG